MRSRAARSLPGAALLRDHAPRGVALGRVEVDEQPHEYRGGEQVEDASDLLWVAEASPAEAGAPAFAVAIAKTLFDGHAPVVEREHARRRQVGGGRAPPGLLRAGSPVADDARTHRAVLAKRDLIEVGVALAHEAHCRERDGRAASCDADVIHEAHDEKKVEDVEQLEPAHAPRAAVAEHCHPHTDGMNAPREVARVVMLSDALQTSSKQFGRRPARTPARLGAR